MRLTLNELELLDTASAYNGEQHKAICGKAALELIEYKKIEEKLGIDLITFMRILYQMDAEDFKPVEKIDKDWIATPYQNVRYSIDLKKKRLIEHGREKHVLKFKEYGKKWALTREELE